MTTVTEAANETREDAKSKLPTHVAKVRHGYGKKATYDRIGVAWVNEDGSYYVKFHGTQIVSNFTLYELDTNAETGA